VTAVKLLTQYITKNVIYQRNLNPPDSRYKNFKPKGIFLHSVGCSQPKAEVFFNSWNKAGTETAVHAVLEPGTVIQCMPWTFRGTHAGSPANDTHIGVEMTEPGTIKYLGGSSWQDLNPAETKKFVLGTYETAAELFAMLCGQLNLDPLKDGVILSHNEGRLRGIATAHFDPEHIWGKFGLTMDAFRRDVAAKMKGGNKVKALIIYSGDADLPPAQMLAYKKGAYLASAAAYKADEQPAGEIYVVGGTWNPDGAVLLSGANRTETAKAVLEVLAK
jgi:hypothetical protein